jgi:hypothetical protein
MFIGHFGVGFGAKRLTPTTSLAILLAAALLPDLLWAPLVLLGWEKVVVAPGDTVVTPLRFVSYPYSHSLLAVAGWSAVLGGACWALRRETRAAVVLAALALSHWVLDFVSHGPDVPLLPWGREVVGLGLWNSRTGSVLAEGGLLVVGVALYLRATQAADRTGRWALASFLVLLALLYTGSLVGPPPPDARAVALSDLGGLLFLLWAHWIERHRLIRAPA